MKNFFSLALAVAPLASVMAMPTPGFQDVGTANLSFYSSGSIGATIGVLNKNNVKAEIEFDYSLKSPQTFGMAAKVGFDECAFSQYSPSFAVGTFGSDIRSKGELATTPNVLFAVVGKSFFESRLHAGVFKGNSTMGEERDGAFVGFTQHLLVEKVDETHKRSRLDLCAEYVTGKSSLAGAKVELKYLISDRYSIKTGPSWSFYKATIPETKKWDLKKMRWLVSFSVNI